jgi:predicted O-methyltransferase YrrM
MELQDIINNSESNNLVMKIAKSMRGKTFHHNYHILYDIRTLLGPEKKIYTEIGTYCGGSCCLMLQHKYDTEINCIDCFNLKNQDVWFNKNINKFNIHNKTINVYKNYSTDTDLLNKLDAQNFKTDILFIDGAHDYNTVMADFKNYNKYVNMNGYIIFDDYLDYKCSPEVKKAVDEIVLTLDTNCYEVIGCLPNVKNSHVAYDIGPNLNEFIIKKIS